MFVDLPDIVNAVQITETAVLKGKQFKNGLNGWASVYSNQALCSLSAIGIGSPTSPSHARNNHRPLINM